MARQRKNKTGSVGDDDIEKGGRQSQGEAADTEEEVREGRGGRGKSQG